MSTKNGQRQYHHGNLREVLINAAVETLAHEPLETFSLRKLAKAAKVSHNAPYMHFKDKEALLTAVADTGFRMLSQEIAHEIDKAEGWRDKLIGGSLAYVRFALERPVHMRIMFRPVDPGTVRESTDVGTQAFDLLVGAIEAGQRAGEMVGVDPRAAAAMIWSTLHGFADITTRTGSAPGAHTGKAALDRLTWMIERQITGLSAER